MRLSHVQENHESDDSNPGKNRVPLPRSFHLVGCFIFRNRENLIHTRLRRFDLVGCFIFRNREDLIHTGLLYLAARYGALP